jgi:hypothetical protein
MSDFSFSPAEAEAMLGLQQTLSSQNLRGNENDLNSFGGPALHIPNIGLLLRRAQVSEGDLTLQHPEVNARIGPFDENGDLDPRDRLHGASRWKTCIGTCFMIGDGAILTARHNFLPPELEVLFGEFAYVLFGHSVLPDGGPRRTFTVNKNVFRIKPPASIDFNSDPEKDWIKLQLDDPDGVLSQRARTDTIPLADCGGDVYTLGHPQGLTLQYARSKVIDRETSGATFGAFIEGYPISSGSPVFDFATDKLVGMQVDSKLLSGRGNVIGAHRSISVMCAEGGDIEATLCVASDVIT